MARRRLFAALCITMALLAALCAAPASALPAAAPRSPRGLARRDSLADIFDEILDKVASISAPQDDNDPDDADDDDADAADDDSDADQQDGTPDAADGGDGDASPNPSESTSTSDDMPAASPVSGSPSPSAAPTPSPAPQPADDDDAPPVATQNITVATANGETKIVVTVSPPPPPKASRALYITAIVLFIVVMISLPILFFCSRFCEPGARSVKKTRFESLSPKASYSSTKSSKKNGGLGAGFANIFADAGRPSTDVRDPYSFRPLADDANDLGRVGLIQHEEEEVDDSVDTLRPSMETASLPPPPKERKAKQEYVNVFAGFKDGEDDGGDGTLYRVSLDSIGEPGADKK
ncbi:hypothetical protein DFJ74DRAFT_704382 [Hyaloraphidium curvatum]|nr:hypothetical protein DFJ74DRAFT_704382 [Hyaloraphidium curvatum]